MAGSKSGPEAWSVVVSVVVAVALAAIALVTVERAGCDDPGRYVLSSRGYELVGGCVEPGDLPVSPAAPAAQNPASPDPRSPLRP